YARPRLSRGGIRPALPAPRPAKPLLPGAGRPLHRPRRKAIRASAFGRENRGLRDKHSPHCACARGPYRRARRIQYLTCKVRRTTNRLPFDPPRLRDGNILPKAWVTPVIRSRVVAEFAKNLEPQRTRRYTKE